MKDNGAAAGGADPLAAVRADAIRLHQGGRTEQAIPLYRRYLAVRPQDSGIWCNLGVALRERKAFAAAEICYRRALELAPDDVAAMGNLGNVLKDMDRLDEALALQQAVVARDPDDDRGRHNYAVALREATRFEEALTQLDTLVARKPDNPTYRWDRSLILLHLGRSRDGWRDYEARRQTGEVKPRSYPQPEWNGEPLAGKTIYLHPEQGYGDTLMALRFLPQLVEQEAVVVLECKPPLRRLLQGCPGVSRLVASEERFEAFDTHCSLMTLPRILGADVMAPGAPVALTVPEAARARVAPLIAPGGDRFKVGIVWSGSVTFKGNAKRAVSLEQFLPLGTVPGVQLYSLQKGPREGDLVASGADAVILDIGTRVDDFAETAAAIEMLDLVIMTDSSVAHLCGSLGRPVWNLLPYHPYWIYPVDSDRTPWYPSMRLFRQQVPGEWAEVFARARTALAAAVAAKAEGHWPPADGN
ncbi:MAG: tetratricopeptide repeat protein [Alphaproteobacteria bacterium]